MSPHPLIHKDMTKVSTSSFSVQIRVRTDSGVPQNRRGRHANEASTPTKPPRRWTAVTLGRHQQRHF